MATAKSWKPFQCVHFSACPLLNGNSVDWIIFKVSLHASFPKILSRKSNTWRRWQLRIDATENTYHINMSFSVENIGHCHWLITCSQFITLSEWHFKYTGSCYRARAYRIGIVESYNYLLNYPNLDVTMWKHCEIRMEGVISLLKQITYIILIKTASIK